MIGNKEYIIKKITPKNGVRNKVIQFLTGKRGIACLTNVSENNKQLVFRFKIDEVTRHFSISNITRVIVTNHNLLLETKSAIYELEVV